MTATNKIKTPSMTLKFIEKEIGKKKAEYFARKFQRVSLMELINSIEV